MKFNIFFLHLFFSHPFDIKLVTDAPDLLGVEKPLNEDKGKALFSFSSVKCLFVRFCPIHVTIHFL